MKINTHRKTFQLSLSALLSALVSLSIVTTAYAAGAVSGRVFRDYNANGARDTYEPGVAGLTVTAYDAAGNVAGTATTAADGTYSINVTVDQVRIEVTGLPSYLKPGPRGTDSETTVTFAASPATNVDIGVNNPTDYCQSNPTLATPVLLNGDQTPTTEVLVRRLYDGSGSNVKLAGANQIGSTWGLAYKCNTRQLFSAAMIKRHAGLGPLGIGGIYVTTNPDGATPVTSNFVNVTTLGINFGTIGTNAARGLGAATAPSMDAAAFGLVGRAGIGDIDLSEDQNFLWVVNLNNRSLVKLNVTGGAVPTSATEYLMSNMGEPACTNGVLRPWGLKFRDGLGYLGAVCSGETETAANANINTNLRAYVFSFDPNNPTTLTTVLNFPLNYVKGFNNNSVAGTNKWYPWRNTYVFANWSRDGGAFLMRSTPILSDIEFDDQGNLVLGFMDRGAVQFGGANYEPTSTNLVAYQNGGDMLKACKNSAGAFVLESNAVCGGNTGFGLNNGNPQAPGGGEFYNDMMTAGFPNHEELSYGSLAQLKGSNQIVWGGMDPTTILEGGLFWSNNTNGAQVRSTQVFLGSDTLNYGGGPTNGRFAKAYGMGDIELLCNAAPIEIGNRLWIDTDGDGIQDPNELPLSGVIVGLYNSAGNLLATATTDANGNYSFSSDPTRANTANAKYNIAGLTADTTGFEIRVDMTQASLNGYALTTANADATANGDLRDSDANLSGTTAVVPFNTAGAGANNHTYDIGLLPLASLGDYVWLDANADGIQDVGEAGFPGVTVFLYKADGALAGTTVTDANGKYTFTNLIPGDYYIEVEHPAGYEHSPLDQGADDAKDSDVDPTLHRSITTTLIAGENDLTWDAGLSPIKAKLGDRVWLDTNANGIQDAGEAGVPGVTVNLYDVNNVLVGTTTTDANGNYLFNILPGEYHLEFIRPAGYVFSPQNQGADNLLDSDAEISTGQTIPVVLAPAQTDLTWDAGMYQPASLGDQVWLDVNADGIQNPGENGIAGVTVKLYTSAGALITTTTTDASGNYNFTNLKPGDYYVEVTPPTGYVVTLQDQGADDTKDSDIDPVTYRAIATTLVSGENDPTWDAGLIQLASLGDLVWLDDNQNGIQDAGENGIAGVTVQLYTAAGTLVKTTITDVNGNYSFINLLPGDYYVAIHHPNGYEHSPQDQGGNDAVDSDIDPVTERTATTTLVAGENDPTWDAGIFFARQITPAIGDFVWLDVDTDGIQDPGESGIPGVIVNLLNGNGNPLPFPLTTTTDANGYYSFGNLDLGNYIVEFIPPTGYSLSPQNTGSNDTLDSDADVTTGQTIPVTLSAIDQMDTTWDAGLYQPASLGDYVWNDLDADGAQDAGESGISNVTVNLYDQNNNLIGTTLTDATGHYQFANLVPGGYYVEFVPPAGYFLSPAHNHPGGNDTIDSDADPVTGKTSLTTLVSGENDPTWDAGMYQLATIGDYIWLDANYNGIQDVGENGIPNVTVNLYLYDINGALVATTVTDANGYYEFTGLQPGDYFIEVMQPAGYEFSPQDQGSDDTLDSDLNPLTHHLPVTTLVSGENDSAWDIGLYQPASIGDFVWLDADADGIQDAGEVGVPGITVKLYDGAGTLKSTMVTDATGHYMFVNLVPGDYYLEFSHPNTYEHSPQDQGGNDALDSDVDHVTERTITTTLNSGENDPSWDLGLYQFASLGNYVWEDMNANGIQDAGEPGISGVTVNLYDASANLVGTTTTDSNGFYQFTGLIPGDYTVEFVAPAGYVVTPQNQGGDDAKDSDADPITVKTVPVNLISGENDPTIDAGMYQPASLGDYVWLDTNANGIQDESNTGIQNVTVNLYDANNTLINTTATDATGYYQFTNLVPGDYHVEFIAPAGYVVSPQHQSGDDATDSDADPTTGLTVVTTLVSGENDPTWDAGLYQAASLGDYVWQDTNANGIQDAGEAGVSSVTVNLYNTSGLAGTTTTDASGYYQFTNLVPGNYYVEFVPPAGYALTLQDQGSDDTVDSDAYTDTNPVLGLFGKTALTALSSGENDPTWDAGLYQAASLGDYVWLDTNANGIQDESNTGIPNVTVNLYDVNNTLINTTATDATGYYQFTNLVPGDYHVEFIAPAGYVVSPQDQGGDDALDSDIDPSTGLTVVTTLVSGENDPTWDAGLYQAASLGDYVWQDTNANGIQDAGEAGVSGVTVNLYDASANLVGTTTTDSNGFYQFTGLIPGDYTVEFVAPAGYVVTPQNQGGDDTKDSDTDPTTGKTAPVNLISGENDPTIDAGMYQPTSLGNYVWLDMNANGIQDESNTGIPNVTVNLYDANNTLINTTATDATGYYQFTNLIPGDYHVEFIAPAGYVVSPQDQGGDDALDSDIDPTTGLTVVTTLVSGENDSTWDAGLYQAASLGDYVWLDTNANGIQDAGEAGISGVTVNLYDASNTQVGTTTTDASGLYQFTGLIPGDYTVEFVAPAGYVVTAQNQGGDDAKDSDADPTTGKTAPVNLISGENDPTIDAGMYQPASLGDYVWLDTNANGIQDESNTGIPNVTVNLYDVNNTLINTTATDATGYYQFTNLVPGDYHVEFIAPAGYVVSPQDQGGDDALDSDIDPTTGLTVVTTLVSGENDSTWDAGLYQAASLGDYVWLDTNANGIQDAGEAGISGVTVNLYDASNTQVGTTTTDASGLYQFTGLIPGDYTVEFVAPAGYVVTPQNQGGDDTKDSDADPTTGKTAPVNLISGENDPTIDAGMYQPASLGDYVWLDTNANGIQDESNTGIQNVTVNLYDANNTLINTTATDATGYYQFTNLTPGDYHVEFIAPAGYVVSPQDQGGDDALDSDIDPTTGLTVVTTLVSGENDPTWDAGLYQAASLGDYVWQDTNVNGIQEAGEAGVSGVTVNLYDANNAVIATTTTDASGYYQFANLTPGNYYVEFIAPAGYALTLKDQGADDTLDSDADRATGLTITTQLDSGENDPTWDAGLYQAASLGNYVWEDTNQNGIQDESNTGIPNVTVKLYDANNAVIATTTTDANGYYQFTNLLPGDYHVGVVPPANYTVSPQDQGADDTLDSDIDPTTGLTVVTTLVSGENDLTWDAGLHHTLAALGDDVWNDYNHNGIQDVGETGVPNVTVNLIDAASGNVIATQQTDANGYYLFSNLEAGKYIVQVGIPAGYVATQQTSGADTSVDSNIDAIGFMAEVTLDWGETNLTLDAGFYRPSGITKTILGTNQTFTSGSDVAIGEIVTYQIVMTVAPGPHDAMKLVDTMDNGLTFAHCVSLTPSDPALTTSLTNGFAEACDPAQTDPAANPKVQNSGRIVTWDFGTVTNGTGQDQTLTLTYEVVVLNILPNQSGVTLNNSASWSFTGQADTVINAPEVKIIESDVSIGKSVSSTNVPYGANLTFTLSINHTTASLTDAYDVVVTDILPPNFTFVPGTINTTGLAPTSVNYDTTSKTLAFVWDVFPLNAASTVSFTTVFNGPAPAANSANVAWTSLAIDPGPTGPIQLSPYNPDSTERWYDPAISANINNYGATASVKIGLPNLPDTGFAPDRVTTLPTQPANKAYSAYGDTWLEIPALNLKSSIMGVPLAGNGWDVTWLGKNVGYLQGTAFPGLSGNSVLSAHVYDANGLPGPFMNLYQLKYGDRFMIHAMGQVYIYEVRSNALFLPSDNSPMRHKKEAWITLLTCQGYNETRDSYKYRRAVQAVLISVAPEK